MIYTNITGHSSWCLNFREGLRDIVMIYLKTLNSENFFTFRSVKLECEPFCNMSFIIPKRNIRSSPKCTFQIKKIRRVMQENLLCKFCIEKRSFLPFLPPTGSQGLAKDDLELWSSCCTLQVWTTLLILNNAEDGTQGFVYTRNTFYQLPYICSPWAISFLFLFFPLSYLIIFTWLYENCHLSRKRFHQYYFPS